MSWLRRGTAGTVRSCEHDGVRLEYVAWPARQSTRMPVLLVPGMAGSAATWHALPGFVQLLRDDGRRDVFAVSLRGRGGSSCPLTGWTAAHHHADVRGVLDAERIARCHLVGHSVGAAYVLGTALESPERVASVTLGDFGPGLPQYGDAWAARMDAVPEPGFHREFPRRLVAEAVRVDHAPRLAELQVPLLVLQGTQSGSLLSDAELRSYETAPRLEVVRVDAGHDVFSSPDAQAACARFIEASDAAIRGQ